MMTEGANGQSKSVWRKRIRKQEEVALRTRWLEATIGISSQLVCLCIPNDISKVDERGKFESSYGPSCDK